MRFPAIARNGSLLTYLYNGDLYTVKPDGTDAHKVTLIARSDDERVTHDVLKGLVPDVTKPEAIRCVKRYVARQA